MSVEPKIHAERFARIRRLKQFLRFMPRRAVLHKYPLIGRFAASARRRAFLWSLKPQHMRPALYAGSVLSLLPVMGVQLPLALALALMLRANFMVLGALQMITNPLTAAPIYYATHQLGSRVLEATGLHAVAPGMHESPDAPLPPFKMNDDATLADSSELPAPGTAARSWLGRVGVTLNALVTGGTLAGLALGLLLDVLYQNFWHRRHRLRPAAPPEVET
jgi:uncharacterized protein (DUF2062 family)